MLPFARHFIDDDTFSSMLLLHLFLWHPWHTLHYSTFYLFVQNTKREKKRASKWCDTQIKRHHKENFCHNHNTFKLYIRQNIYSSKLCCCCCVLKQSKKEDWETKIWQKLPLFKWLAGTFLWHLSCERTWVCVCVGVCGLVCLWITVTICLILCTCPINFLLDRHFFELSHLAWVDEEGERETWQFTPWQQQMSWFCVQG